VTTSENLDPKTTDGEVLKRERYEVLKRLEDWLETPMLVLAFVWLALLIVELIWGESLLLDVLGTIKGLQRRRPRPHR
jgi:voltage-gated potassium channel